MLPSPSFHLPKTKIISPSMASSSSLSPILRPWSDLSYDLLVLILSRLTTVDLIVGLSAVCSSWRAAAKDPHCWRIVDLSDRASIARRFTGPVRFGKLFKRVLVLASDHERIEKVFLPPMATGQDLILVSQRLPNLLHLSFPNHKLDENKICTAIGNFKSLQRIDAVEDFFHITVGAVSHLKTVVEVKLLSGAVIRVWKGEMKHHRDWLLAYIIVKVFPNLRKVEMFEVTYHGKYLQHIKNRAEHQDISTITNGFKTAEMRFVQTFSC